jgi:hypothetical protein
LKKGKMKKWVFSKKGWRLLWSIEVLQEGLKSNIGHSFIAKLAISSET